MKNRDVRTVYIGMRKLDLIEGLVMNEYLPDGITKYIHMALDDQKMQWTDDVIQNCTMVISAAGYRTVMYKYDAQFCKGLMLFGFTDEPEHDYRFSFPLKQFHMEYYTRIN